MADILRAGAEPPKSSPSKPGNPSHNCKRLRAPPRQPGRPQDRKGGKRVSQKKGGRAEQGGGGGGGGTPPDKRDPPRHRFAAPPRDWGGSHRAGGWRQKIWYGGKGWLGGRRPDPGLLVPDASRQEAEANIWLSVFEKEPRRRARAPPSLSC